VKADSSDSSDPAAPIGLGISTADYVREIVKEARRSIFAAKGHSEAASHIVSIGLKVRRRFSSPPTRRRSADALLPSWAPILLTSTTPHR
jgi:hypothetical protein